eukprot:Clim_evm20s224 gene=Clim_evmTU20s224
MRMITYVRYHAVDMREPSDQQETTSDRRQCHHRANHRELDIMPTEAGTTVAIQGTLHVQADKVEEAKKIFRELAKEVQLEDGCAQYTFGQNIDDPTVFSLIEEWRDHEAWRNHHKAAPFQNHVKVHFPIIYTQEGFDNMKGFLSREFIRS